MIDLINQHSVATKSISRYRTNRTCSSVLHRRGLQVDKNDLSLGASIYGRNTMILCYTPASFL